MTQSIRAQVIDDFHFAGGGVAIRVVVADVDDSGMVTRSHRVLTRNDANTFYWRHITDDERMGVTSVDDPSVIRFPEGVGEALLSALARHFNGQASDLDLRADLRHERSRRDKLEDAIVSIVTHVPGPIRNLGGGGGLGGTGGSFASGGH